MARESVRGTVAQRDESDGQLEAVKQLIRDARGWFNAVIPSHVNADQFVAVGLGVLSKDPQLADVAKRNPQSFMVALSECARLGLVPGDGYALTYFGNSIVGIVEYTGELELIHRAGQVRTVCAEIVWTHDTFSRGAHPHDPPTFEPAGGRFPSEQERGQPEGGFAYAVFENGTTSRVVYMAADEIMLHKKAARNKNVWEGDFWRSMWLKTFVHELYKWVPKSPEFLAASMRVLAAGELPGQPQQAVPAVVHPALEGGDPGVPPPGSQEPAEPSPADGGGKVNPAVLKAITTLLDEFGCSLRQDRLDAVSVLARRHITKPNDLTAAEGENVRVALEGMRRVAGDDPVGYWPGAMDNLEQAWRNERPQDFEPEPDPQ